MVKCSGRVKTFLNEDFGIIEFSEANATPAKCLFDTYNVYLKGGKTAAESKLTVGNVLALDMKVGIYLSSHLVHILFSSSGMFPCLRDLTWILCPLACYCSLEV